MLSNKVHLSLITIRDSKSNKLIQIALSVRTSIIKTSLVPMPHLFITVERPGDNQLQPYLLSPMS